jgi:serine phosphatase RsbU (regulator of sigma subunit)/PAS domain-containing protein
MRETLRSTALALGVTLAIVVLDLITSADVTLVPLLVAGPLLAAMTTDARGAAFVGGVSLVAAIALGIILGEGGTATHVVAISTVAVAAVLGPIIAGTRERQRAARRTAERALARSDLLARASELFEGGADPLANLDAIAALPLPELADLCIVDLIAGDGALRPGGVAAREPEAAEALRRSRELNPVGYDSEHPVAVVARTGEPMLIATVGERELELWQTATGPSHTHLVRRLGFRSIVVVPLSARGRTIGTLAIVRMRGRSRYGPDDVEVAVAVARRAGLAIDHARLGNELGELASELQTVISVLAEAVFVHDRAGRLLYANEAAANLRGVASAADLLAMPEPDPLGRYELYDERGVAVGPAQLPGNRALAGERRPELVMQAVDRETGEQGWRLAKASPILGPDGRPRLAVIVVEDITEQRRREQAQTFLARASKLLTASLDPEYTLQEVAWAAVPELADWCAVDMPDERGRLRRVATADRSPERTALSRLVIAENTALPRMPVGPPNVMRTGVSELYPTIDEQLLRMAATDDAQLQALRDVGARSVLIVPMVAGGQTIGTITLGTIESQRRLGEDDLALAEELGRRAGIAVEHAQVHRDRSAIAATLQAALLPPSLPAVAGLEVAARFRAAGGGTTVGGDFYDVWALPGEPRAWMIVMGDVTGKGPEAAAITALARYTMRTAALYERDPSRVLERLNHALLHDADQRRLCTAVVVRVVPGEPDAAGAQADITISAAGHPLPLRVRPDGRLDEVGSPGTLLGAFEPGHWSDVDVHLEAGDAIVLFTDGVTDARGDADRFGDERLGRVVAATAGASAGAVAAQIDQALIAFQGGVQQRDDIALLVLRPPPAPAPGVQTSEVAGSPFSAG